MSITLHHGDCLEIMATMEPNSVDSIVTDPPYGLAFMGKDWDHGVPGIPFWEAALRVAKPGAHLLAFGGTRTFHRLAVAIEDAGWEIRDTVMWVYGSGFPKSHDVSKAIDREAGAEREVVGRGAHCGLHHRGGANSFTDDNWKAENREGDYSLITAPATPDAERWQGWGTALKPAWEPVIVARKPLQGTVAANVLTWGTGAININACRVGTDAGWSYPNGRGGNGWMGRETLSRNLAEPMQATSGRWPANVIHDGSDEVVGLMPANANPDKRIEKLARNGKGTKGIYGDTGSAARFFYCAKASRADRDEGLEGMPKRGRNEVYGNGLNTATKCDPAMGHTPDSVEARPQVRNHHPTVKPTDLMRYLCRLVTPPGGVVLDPFMGSGSTGKAAILEGFAFAGIEQDAEYVEIARRRIEAAKLPLLEACP